MGAGGKSVSGGGPVDGEEAGALAACRGTAHAAGGEEAGAARDRGEHKADEARREVVDEHGVGTERYDAPEEGASEKYCDDR